MEVVFATPTGLSLPAQAIRVDENQLTISLPVSYLTELEMGARRESYLDDCAKRITKQIEEAIRFGTLRRLRQSYRLRRQFLGYSLFEYLDDFLVLQGFVDGNHRMYAVLSTLLETASACFGITINGIFKSFGDTLKSVIEEQNRLAAAVFAKQRKSTFTFKALHKPLQVIPESIRPIELSA